LQIVPLQIEGYSFGKLYPSKSRGIFGGSYPYKSRGILLANHTPPNRGVFYPLQEARIRICEQPPPNLACPSPPSTPPARTTLPSDRYTGPSTWGSRPIHPAYIPPPPPPPPPPPSLLLLSLSLSLSLLPFGSRNRAGLVQTILVLWYHTCELTCVPLPPDTPPGTVCIQTPNKPNPHRPPRQYGRIRDIV